MCEGISYVQNDKEFKVYFSQRYSMLPIVTKEHSIKYVYWGRKKEEPGNLPLGGWARLEAILVGDWDKYFPKPVKIKAKSFMEKDFENNSYWYQLIDGQYIQGLLARFENEFRVYIVTILPKRLDSIHNRWPKIINFR